MPAVTLSQHFSDSQIKRAVIFFKQLKSAHERNPGMDVVKFMNAFSKIDWVVRVD